MSSTSIFFFFLFCSLILSLDWLILVTLFCFYLVGFTHLCFVFVNYGLFAMLCVRYLLGHFYFVSCIHYFIYVLFLLIIVCLLCYVRGIWLLEILSGVFVAWAGISCPRRMRPTSHTLLFVCEVIFYYVCCLKLFAF